MKDTRDTILEFVEKIGDIFNKFQNNVEEFLKIKFGKLAALKDSLQQKSVYTYENHYTEFGKEREYLIDIYKEIIEKEKEKDTASIRTLVQNMFNDHDELVRKYHGIVPLDYSTQTIPDKAHVEEGREIEVEILQFFPSSCPREHIIQHVTEMVKHVQETSYPDTPIWVKVTQHKEK